MNAFDGQKIEVLLTMAWLGLIAGDKGPADLTDADDLTPEQEAFRRVRLALTRAARVSKLGESAASIVHEVNQPLAAIQLNSQTALRWLDGNPQNVARARTLIERIIQDTGRTVDIVAHIWGTASGYAPQLTNLALDDIITETVTFLQHELHSNDVVVSLDLTSSPSRINGNRSQLQQVVVNLVINAIHALANINTVTRTIAIRTSKLHDELVCCTVEDSGPGIDPSHLPHLFEDVFTTKPKGMGMGLLISKSIVATHGGGIRADNYSTLGGARFTLTLPVTTDSAST